MHPQSLLIPVETERDRDNPTHTSDQMPSVSWIYALTICGIVGNPTNVHTPAMLDRQQQVSKPFRQRHATQPRNKLNPDMPRGMSCGHRHLRVQGQHIIVKAYTYDLHRLSRLQTQQAATRQQSLTQLQSTISPLFGTCSAERQLKSSTGHNEHEYVDTL